MIEENSLKPITLQGMLTNQFSNMTYIDDLKLSNIILTGQTEKNTTMLNRQWMSHLSKSLWITSKLQRKPREKNNIAYCIVVKKMR